MLLVISNIVTFLFARRVRKAKTEQEEQAAIGSELENVEKGLGVYREMLNDIKRELAEMADKYKILENAFDQIEEENISLRKENERLKVRNAVLEDIKCRFSGNRICDDEDVMKDYFNRKAD